MIEFNPFKKITSNGKYKGEVTTDEGTVVSLTVRETEILTELVLGKSAKRSTTHQELTRKLSDYSTNIELTRTHISRLRKKIPIIDIIRMPLRYDGLYFPGYFVTNPIKLRNKNNEVVILND